MIRKGMVFGVFDGLHKGHRYFFTEAAKRCETLVVVVARPETNTALKARVPKQSLEERIKKIQEFNRDFLVIPGDQELGQWQVVKTHSPDAILLGHDQQKLKEALAEMRVPFIFLSRYSARIHPRP
ncbi:hypothetical protein A3D66_00435 [Candidatus Kaiserbacteria bacterium RIFCSPHIGHO2_02_FULL_50_9]|uniref:Cytidyltransferase-like domain-containing protein n=1 Tax=Candidatus Kaiserbacteria bacterium RIFCSPLOWO2_01_FULL_51_21 TaxID=1798508 RepID=A0A1F6ED32_9BACT|nr:MAG: hypothetical protein A2761_01915 [Candidatus Kaiserbacteria bacterium RIFCSPHIGHO2_01_FULL_51_33]OGG63192.1 MAG: hypothetical protein A3D66_00435 [Candidatus Kaiserbacteria bacterium RIFCSPHIGHO2_02_FULL_50_9]OGG71556.1 MAG: hypothetical protein A3A35_00215 [Candidatus Kaiserbacteria bacterium RIFCSPLOWO2_01_FULL_51_21]